jgi:hypothetical protein
MASETVYLVEYFASGERPRPYGFWLTEPAQAGERQRLVPSRRPGLTTAGVRRFATSEEAVAAGDSLLADGLASAYQVQSWTLAG